MDPLSDRGARFGDPKTPSDQVSFSDQERVSKTQTKPVACLAPDPETQLIRKNWRAYTCACARCARMRMGARIGSTILRTVGFLDQEIDRSLNSLSNSDPTPDPDLIRNPNFSDQEWVYAA